MSNRAIAQALFVTVKTVETHLRSVYRKLGVSGRRELGVALSGATTPARGRRRRRCRPATGDRPRVMPSPSRNPVGA